MVVCDECVGCVTSVCLCLLHVQPSKVGRPVSALPPCGVLPHLALALYITPLSYLYDSDALVYHAFRAMVRLCSP